MKSVQIELISDFICPWCYIGKIRLDRVKTSLASEIALHIRIKPYVLYPHIPKGGLPKADFARRSKPGMGRSLRDEAAQEGIQLNYRQIKRIPNSLEAHRLITLISDPAQQYAVAKSIFQAYFEAGRNIEDPLVLSQLAREAGVAQELIAAFTSSQAGADAVQADLDQLQAEYIRVVPSLRLAQTIVLPGLQPVEVWENYIRRAAELSDQN